MHSMTLFKVHALYNIECFYWAERADDAKKMYIEQNHPDTPVLAERVWADNDDLRYRGYVVESV